MPVAHIHTEARRLDIKLINIKKYCVANTEFSHVSQVYSYCYLAVTRTTWTKTGAVEGDTAPLRTWGLNSLKLLERDHRTEK